MPKLLTRQGIFLPKERSKNKMNVLQHIFGLKISKKMDM